MCQPSAHAPGPPGSMPRMLATALTLLSTLTPGSQHSCQPCPVLFREQARRIQCPLHPERFPARQPAQLARTQAPAQTSPNPGASPPSHPNNTCPPSQTSLELSTTDCTGVCVLPSAKPGTERGTLLHLSCVSGQGGSAHPRQVVSEHLQTETVCC